MRLAVAIIAVMSAAVLAPAPASAADLVFTTVTVNGHEGVFLVDTGAPVSLIGASFAKKADLPLGQATSIRGGGGERPARIAENLSVRAEGGPTMHLDPPVADLDRMRQVLGHDLDGILGGDYFGRMAVEFDYRSGKARFLQPEAVAPPTDAVRLNIVATPYIEAVAVQDGRRVKARFQIDTGSNTAVEFHTPFARRSFPQVQGEATGGLGVAGATRARMAPLESFEVGGRELRGLTANFADDLRPDDAPRDYGGIIGGPAFAGQVLTVDYGRDLMWVR